MKQQAQKKTYETDKDVWREFTGKHKGHRFLKCNPLYAIPKELVAELRKLRFFSPEDVAFELDLAALTGGGFWKRVRFGYPPLNEPVEIGAPLQSSIELEGRAAQADSQLLDLLFPVNENSDIERARRKEYQRDAAKFKEKVMHAQAAFAGWLVGDRQYRTELAGLKSRWQEEVDRIGGFPQFPLSFFGETLDLSRDFSRECQSDFHLLFRRWGLETIVTWDLPLPMRPGIEQVLRNTLGLGESGLLAFFPWCMLRNRQITVRQLAQSSWRQDPPKHLSEWLQLSPADNKKLGPVRYERMLFLFRVLELALRPRYGDSPAWNQSKIDQALGMLSDGNSGDPLGEENVRKVRQALQRGLGDPGRGVEEADEEFRRVVKLSRE